MNVNNFKCCYGFVYIEAYVMPFCQFRFHSARQPSISVSCCF